MKQSKVSETVARTVKCADCGTVLNLENPPRTCPKCGSEAQVVELRATDPLPVSMREKVSLTTIREFYEKNHAVLWAVIAITIISPFLGLVLIGWVGVIVGLILGVASFLLSPFAVTKVREIKERTT